MGKKRGNYIDTGKRGTTIVTQNPIDEVELRKTRNSLYPGMPVRIWDKRGFADDKSRKHRVIKNDAVSGWFKNVITFESGLTCTMAEMAMYIRNCSMAIGEHFVNY